MESNHTHYYVDRKVEQTLRNFKEGDHTIFLYGIDNLVLGIWNSKNDLEQFVLTLPSGFKINGIVIILNDDVYQDYDSNIEQELNNLKELTRDNEFENIISENFVTLVMKDVLYLDDFDSITFEKNQLYINETFGSDLEVVFKDLENELIKNYLFLHSKLNIDTTSNQENLIETNTFVIDSNLSDVENIIDNLNFYIYMDEESLLIDNINKLDQSTIEHITKLINKLTIDKKEDIKFYFGIKNKEGEMQNINKIKILSSNEKGYNLESEFGGLLVKNNNSQNSILKTLVYSLKLFLKSLVKNNKMKNENLLQRKLIEKSIFSSHEIFAIINKENNKIYNEETITKTMNIFTSKFINGLSIKHTVKRLVNPHLQIEKALPEYSKRYQVKGLYEYYHYNQDGDNDKGWGCAYRSLQTLFSWFLMNGFNKEGLKVPSILDIQKALVKVGDKEPKLIGSSDWIGAFEVSIVLNELLGIESQIIYVSSGAELTSKGRELAFHFETHGTPIMIGGGVYAYTILGVEYDRVKGDCLFLILDPHYLGEEDVKTIISKGWCSWKNSALFEKGSFYNLCLPQIPK